MGSLERRNRRLTGALLVLATLWLISAAAFAILTGRVSSFPSSSAVLRVRGLVVVDANGVERVWVGAPLPEPLDLGKRFPRGGEVAGILLFDAEGNERSGYVTSEGYPNVFFTLDSIGKQQVLFLTDPGGTPFLKLWNKDNAFQVSVDEESPSLKVTRGGQVIFEAPHSQSDKR